MKTSSAAALLDAQIDCLEKTLAALGEERTALAGRDSEALRLATERKRACIDEAASMESDIRQRDIGVAPSLSERIARLGDLARQCRDQNQLNGALILARREHLTSALHVLRGESTQPQTYDDAGLMPRHHGRLDITAA